jgi:transmembrane sensor
MTSDLDQQRRAMSHIQPAGSDRNTAGDQALAWVMRLASGTATTADAEALRRWRGESAAHRLAFAEAKLLWDALGPAAKEVALRSGPTSAPARSTTLIGRRALLGGALAASAAAVGYVGSKPPFRFWPSVGELRADFRTATGERRPVVLSGDVSLILNTQTSIGLARASTGPREIELISGEAAIHAHSSTAARFDVVAAGGRATATAARFDMRRDGETVRVACLDGVVRVERNESFVTVPQGHQVTYDLLGLQQVLPVDLAVATAWQSGQLIFRHEPLARVIEEVNRYRPGRIVLINRKLGQRDVVATFHLDRIDEVVAHLTRAFDARAHTLPGGVVLLS